MTRGKRGNCYVTSEAVYHLLGGRRSGWRPYQIHWQGTSHWFLGHPKTGLILDLTVWQFKRPPPYGLSKQKGWLTKRPSKRARELMGRLLWAEQ
jgi:hypothetical protein